MIPKRVKVCRIHTVLNICFYNRANNNWWTNNYRWTNLNWWTNYHWRAYHDWWANYYRWTNNHRWTNYNSWTNYNWWFVNNAILRLSLCLKLLLTPPCFLCNEFWHLFKWIGYFYSCLCRVILQSFSAFSRQLIVISKAVACRAKQTDIWEQRGRRALVLCLTFCQMKPT